jgi:hypothetical protein
MAILIILILVIAGIIVLLLVMAPFMKSEQYVNREIIISAPRQKVFDYLKLLKNQTDGTIGYIYAWYIEISHEHNGANGRKTGCEKYGLLVCLL